MHKGCSKGVVLCRRNNNNNNKKKYNVPINNSLLTPFPDVALIWDVTTKNHLNFWNPICSPHLLFNPLFRLNTRILYNMQYVNPQQYSKYLLFRRFYFLCFLVVTDFHQSLFLYIFVNIYSNKLLYLFLILWTRVDGFLGIPFHIGIPVFALRPLK